jgi:long-subunit fatty acid transport protein
MKRDYTAYLQTAIIAALILLLPAALVAGNYNSFFLGDDAALTAGSISALTSDAEAIWYNPAGMGGNDLNRVELSGNAFMMRLQNIEDGMQVVLPSGTQSQNLTGNEFLAVPNTMAFMRQFNKDVSVGVGIFVPQSTDLTFDSSFESVEQFDGYDYPMNYKQGYSLDILNYNYQFGGAAGWRVNKDFKLGAALFVTYDRFRINKNQFEDVSSAVPESDLSLFFVDNYRVLLSTLGIRSTLGMQWEFKPGWHFGTVLYSPTFQMYSWGETSESISGSGVDEHGKTYQKAEYQSQSIHEFEGHMVEPFHFLVSMAMDRPDYWIGATADFFLPLEKKNLMIDRRFNWNVSVGGKYKLNENISLGAGLFTDNSPNTSIKQLDDQQINYYGITFGQEYTSPVSRGKDNNPILFSTTIACRCAIGIGQVGGQIFDPQNDLNIAHARVTPVDVRFYELSAYVGSSLQF